MATPSAGIGDLRERFRDNSFQGEDETDVILHSAFRTEASAAKMMFDDPSWDKGWISSRACEGSTREGG